MSELLPCRWRREPLPDNRHACVSHKVHAPPRGVTAQQCATCWCRDHEPPPARLGTCVHLGRRVGVADCPPCAAKTGRAVQVPAHECSRYGRCTIATSLPGIRCCQHCPDFAPAPPPAAAGSVRHLMYFICPLGQLWRWNVEQLKRRLSLFNGERHICIVHGPGLAPVELVKQEIGEVGSINYHVEVNHPVLKEYVGFPRMLRALSKWQGEGDVTFYGHAKGVNSASWGPGVPAWADSMYAGNLDYWPAVRRELAGHCCCGLWRKRQGWYPVSPSLWHYAGSFRWIRNRDMYSRNWDEYIVDWCCPEDHVGRVFRLEESACLYGDCGSAATQLYGQEAWELWAKAERANWEAAHAADRWEPLLTSILLTAHSQPTLVFEAIASVRDQSSPNWELIVLDSGNLDLSRYQEAAALDARLRLEATGERLGRPAGVGGQSWALNEAWRRGLVRGDLVLCLSDDDVLAPDHVEVVQGAAARRPAAAAWWRAAERVELLEGGEVRQLPRLELPGLAGPADLPGGRIDGMQLTVRRAAWQAWPEALEDAPLADARWMDRIALAHPIYPLDGVCGVHRHTPLSTFTRPT